MRIQAKYNHEMKYLLMALILLVSGCSFTEKDSSSAKAETKTTDAELSAQELEAEHQQLIVKLINAESLNLELNGNQKWNLTAETYVSLLKMKQQVYVLSGNMENYTNDSYNLIGKEFLEFIELIPKENNPAINLEYQKVIVPLKKQCTTLLGANLQDQQIAIINMSVILDEVPNFFQEE